MKRITILSLLALAGCSGNPDPAASTGATSSPPPSVSPSEPGANAATTAGDAGRAAAASGGSNDSVATAWPFKDPEKLAVITLSRILNDSKPILYVVHDEDGDWQFLDGDDVSEEDAETVALRRVFERDRTVGELADLPTNWTAERAAVGQPWTRAPRQ